MSMQLHTLKHVLMRTQGLEGDALARRLAGKDWPADAETMIGEKRLDNLYHCISAIVNEHVDGNIIETGVWRGGACIYMQAILKELGSSRKIYLCDSFQGFPQPKNYLDEMSNGDFIGNPIFNVSLDQVKDNFKKYELFDENLVFVEGFFEETLHKISDTFAIIRLDGDMFDSTMVALNNLYPKLNDRGFIIIDDYWSITACKAAVDSYRAMKGITNQITTIDSDGIFWRK